MADIKVKEVIVESNIPGLGGEYDSIVMSTIHTGLQQLKHFKRTNSSDDPGELDWEIKLYEWILAQPDAEVKAKEYMDARHVTPEEGYLLEKREVVRRLGWKI